MLHSLPYEVYVSSGIFETIVSVLFEIGCQQSHLENWPTALTYAGGLIVY